MTMRGTYIWWTFHFKSRPDSPLLQPPDAIPMCYQLFMIDGQVWTVDEVKAETKEVWMKPIGASL